MIHSQADAIKRFAPNTDAEILLHFSAIEREVSREQRGGVKDIVLFRLRRWKNEVRIGETTRLRATLVQISALPAIDYGFAQRAYVSSALLIHSAIELSER
jgi:hypothetical protein